MLVLIVCGGKGERREIDCRGKGERREIDCMHNLVDVRVGLHDFLYFDLIIASLFS